MFCERKSDPPGLRSVFRLNAPRFEDLENAADEEYGGWGSLLLEASLEAFGEIEFSDAVSYGREVAVVIKGTRFVVHLGFQGPSWLGFVNEGSALLDSADTRRALGALDRRLRETDGVLELKWMDLSAFRANREDWEDAPFVP